MRITYCSLAAAAAAVTLLAAPALVAQAPPAPPKPAPEVQKLERNGRHEGQPDGTRGQDDRGLQL